jgi:hypothetical protein
MAASDESASWLLLSALYHRVRARMPTDRAAQIAITEARRGGRLRMRAELRVHEARPDLRLAPGEKPPPIQPKVTPDYPILPTDVFQEWDWEYSRATRRDQESRTLFEYVNIVVHRDDALACWPEATEPAAATTTVDLPPTEWSEVQARSLNSSMKLEALKRPKGVTPRVWAAVQAIDAFEREEHVDPASIPQDDLLPRVRRRMPERSKSGARVPLGKRTMETALAYRRARDGTK